MTLIMVPFLSDTPSQVGPGGRRGKMFEQIIFSSSTGCYVIIWSTKLYALYKTDANDEKMLWTPWFSLFKDFSKRLSSTTELYV